MKELSLNILDVAENGVSAGASLVGIYVDEQTEGRLTITITDNGRGMTEEFVSKVLDPFTTTRTTRKVGMGLPLFKLAAEQTGGSLTIKSTPGVPGQPGVGTVVTAVFMADSIDMPPLGDIAGTMFTLISGAPDIDFDYRHTKGANVSELDTRILREELEDVPLDTPDVLLWIKESITEAEETL